MSNYIPERERLFEILRKDGREDLIEEIKNLQNKPKKTPERRLVIPASQQYTAPRRRSLRKPDDQS